MNKLTTILAAVAVVGAGSLALAQSRMDQSSPGMTMPSNEHGHGTSSDNAVTRAYQEVNARMHNGMMIDFTGDADVDFMRSMIPHHQGAVDMARVELKYGSDPAARKLAESIISTQESEIAMMRKWLADRGK